MPNTEDLGLIDLTKIRANLLHQRVLVHLFLDSKYKIYEPKTPYTIIYNENIFKFQLSHSILRRKCKHNSKEFRYEVFDNSTSQINKNLAGAFATVRNVDFTLTLDANNNLLIKNGDRVIKKEIKNSMEDPIEFKQLIKDEIALTQLIPHRGAKKPVFVKTGSHLTSYSTLRKLPGENFEKILNDENKKKRVLSTRERIDISLAILRKLETQIHDNNIIHRDFKPANIMIAFASKKYNIIDLGLSKLAGKKAKEEKCGTPIYMAPEQWLGETTVQLTDTYGAGRTLAVLWGMHFKTTKGTIAEISRLSYNKQEALTREAAMSELKFNTDFFDAISDIDDECKHLIKETISYMTYNALYFRWNTQNGIEKFERVKLAWQISHVKTNKKITLDSLEPASLAASTLRNHLRKLSKPSLAKVTPETIKTLIIKSLNTLTDSPAAIELFTDMLDIDNLKGLKNKKTIIDKLNTVCSEYNKTIKRQNNLDSTLQDFSSQLNEHYFSPYFVLGRKVIGNLVSVINRKIEKYNKTFDDFSELAAIIDPLFKPNEATIENVLILLFDYHLSNDNSALNVLKLGIKQALGDYISNTYTSTNIKMSDRSASQKRVRDMYKILMLVNKFDGDPINLIDQLRTLMGTIQHTSYPCLHNHFFRKFTKSELINNIETRLMQYEANNINASRSNKTTSYARV